MLKARVEAVLFLTDKPIKAQALARTLNEDVQTVRQALLELIHDYEERKGGLEIADDNGYIIQVKDEYSVLINEFQPLDMPVALLRTLSAIAIKQPVMQSDVIKIRGAGAYDHIKELLIRELIIKKDEGRSPVLSTTKKFQEYFRLSGDGKMLRTELKKERKTEDESERQLELPLDGESEAAAAAVAASGAPVVELETPDIADHEIELVSDPGDAAVVEKLEEVFDASPDFSATMPLPDVDKFIATESGADNDVTEQGAEDIVVPPPTVVDPSIN